MTSTSAATGLLPVLKDLIRTRYVLADRAVGIADSLDDVSDLPSDAEQLATLLTEHLLRVSGDRHLRVRHRPHGAAAGFDCAEHERRYAAEAVHSAGGIRQVTRIDAQTGLLEIAPYTSPVHLAGPYVEAAFTLVARVRHLVIDLRQGLGGTPETIALICGHLLGREPVHLQDLVQRSGDRRQFWTSPAANRLADDTELHVLTSSRTFSGCEELAYNLQALGRATVVGETTGGGAHPVESFRATSTLQAHIPVAMSVNAVTGTNWEGVGVRPDIPCPANEALQVAVTRRPRPSGSE
jgi:hypothetical protein